MPKTQVQEVSIGDAPICPVYDLGLTDSIGSFTVEGTVPGVMEGGQVVKVRVTQDEGEEITTPFTVIGWSPEDYDFNMNDKIDYSEMVSALMDYLKSDISYSQMDEVLMLYLMG